MVEEEAAVADEDQPQQHDEQEPCQGADPCRVVGPCRAVQSSSIVEARVEVEAAVAVDYFHYHPSWSIVVLRGYLQYISFFASSPLSHRPILLCDRGWCWTSLFVVAIGKRVGF